MFVHGDFVVGGSLAFRLGEANFAGLAFVGMIGVVDVFYFHAMGNGIG